MKLKKVNLIIGLVVLFMSPLSNGDDLRRWDDHSSPSNKNFDHPQYTDSLTATQPQIRFPNANEALVVHTAPTRPMLQTEKPFSALIWNLYKGKNPGLYPALEQLTAEHDVVLTQESLLTSNLLDLFFADADIGWATAVSFYTNEDFATGVSNGIRYHTNSQAAIVSDPKEPILNTPKMILVTHVPVEGWAAPLIIANIHAINFVTTGTFKKHIAQLLQVLNHQDGPLFVGGDFNTWSGGRMQHLDKSLAEIGMKRVGLKQNNRRLKLDHVYVRHIEIHDAELLDYSEESDHNPISILASVKNVNKSSTNLRGKK